MAKDASLFPSLDMAKEKKIYLVDNFSLNTARHGGIPYWHGQIIDVYHVHIINANILSISKLSYTGKLVKFWMDIFFLKYLKNDRSIVIEGFLNSKEWLYKFCALSWLFPKLASLIAQIDEKSSVWHEQLGHLNFLAWNWW